MESFLMTGGRRLEGVTAIHGAKNSVLPILAASVLCRGRCVLHNCPQISDVDTSVAILRHMGCTVQRSGDTLTVDASAVTRCDVPLELMRDMRSSVLFMGAALARCGRAEIALPGGCALGQRPIDLHLAAMEQLGANCTVESEHILCESQGLHGAQISLAIPSVGATENVLLAAMGCSGVVLLQNAAREPEITDLVQFLRVMGAEIYADGSGTLEIWGGRPLRDAEYTVMPDRIETATYWSAVAACGGDAYLRGGRREECEAVATVLEQTGCRIRCDEGGCRITTPKVLRPPAAITTGPYPAFPTDAQAPVMAALLRMDGETEILETVFENRMRHVAQMQKLGADIQTDGCRATVRGVKSLHGAELWGSDLRCGAALMIAGLSAEGTSRVYGVKYIRRGYESLDGGLRALGADIRLANM